MNKQDLNIMKTYFKTIASIAVVFTLVLVPVAKTVAFGGLDFVFNNDTFTQTDTTVVTTSSSVGSSSSINTFCNITASRSLVDYGGSFTINWDTGGFSNITINGEQVSGNSGSKVIDKFYTKTTFELKATDGKGSTCTQRVIVDCEQPPATFCELQVTKSVNKNSAKVGDFLTYTINVKNIGDADCTGDGVKIQDVIDPNLSYVSNSVSSNLTAGYGSTAVYNASNKTLYFNGGTLTPQESGTITWVAKVENPTQCGDFEVKNQAQATAKELNNFQDWKYSQIVKTSIDNDCYVPYNPECTLTPATQTVGYGEKATLNWTTKNAYVVSISELGSVAVNGSIQTPALFSDKTYVLTAVGNDSKQVSCEAKVVVTNPDPSCDLFTASPSTITVGSKTTLNWESTNATQANINNGVGIVTVDGSVEVYPLVNTIYVLTLTSAGNKTVNCQVPVTVSADPVPSCDLFTASPNSLPYGGGNVSLDWKVSNATSVNITPTVGLVNLTGTRIVAVTQSTTFTLTAVDSNNDEVSCTVPVTVATQDQPLTCSDNVNFSVNDSSITRGDDVTLTWSTTDVDSVSISEINETSLSGSKTVSPSSDITYTLTAKRGSETVNCPVSVDVSTGGGGGGSSSPRCELDISDKNIKRGDEITLTWDTSNATEITIKDDRGKIIFTTDKFLSSDKRDYYDGSVTLKPTRDTEFTLIAERGSKDRECSVKVNVDDSIVVLQSRDQQPLVAGISLSQVPYTGFEAGPFLTILFYVLLIAWSLYITYLVIVRRRIVSSGDAFVMDSSDLVSPNMNSMKQAETVRPDVFVRSVSVAEVVSDSTPSNLPTGSPVIGYQNYEEDSNEVNPHQISDEVVTELENRAHSQNALLSSDAVRYFIATTSGELERNQALDEVIAEAKKNYPLEDGWTIINESRMQNLCITCMENKKESTQEAFTPTTIPEGSGSLAEAIVTGNIVAAYDMIGSRPMFSLADAAADLDALYRFRKDDSVQVSELLKTETARLSDTKIKNMISALTGALDGTYSDEASAVKMAIMKAVKEAA